MKRYFQSMFSVYLSTYLGASFDSRKLSISYNTITTIIDQPQTLSILCVDAWKMV